MNHVGVLTSCYFNFLKHVGINPHVYIPSEERENKKALWQEKIAKFNGKFVYDPDIINCGTHDGNYTHIDFETKEDMLYFTLLFK